MKAALIGVDWGTTNLRAFRYGADGAVLETKRAATGVSAVKDGAYEATLRDALGDWLNQPPRIIVCGMAGAREGWLEAPYLPCPLALTDLVTSLRQPQSALDVSIAPGLCQHRGDGIVEIMRGEETQILGALAPDETALVIAPGTHSKWAQVKEGRVLDIRTYMTGEIYALLKTHSILARLMQGDAHDAAAFALGVTRGLAESALLNLVFSARSAGLFEEIARPALAAYLSGLLIGSEIAEGLSRLKPERETRIVLIAAPSIASHYHNALAQAGARNVIAIDGEDAAARGLWRLANP